MEQSPSLDTNGHSASQEIPHLLQNSKVHYQVDKSLLPVPILFIILCMNIFSLIYFLYLNFVPCVKTNPVS